MVRKGHCGTAVVRGTAAKRVDAAGSVQKRVLTVNVKMYESAHRTAFLTPAFTTVKLKKRTD